MAAAGHTKTSNSDVMAVLVVYRDVEAVKFLMLPFPAPLEVLFFPSPLPTFGNFCFRFRLCIELVTSEFASSSILSSKCFHKNLTASTTSSFCFHIPVCNSCDWLCTRFYKLLVTLLGLLDSATC